MYKLSIGTSVQRSMKELKTQAYEAGKHRKQEEGYKEQGWLCNEQTTQGLTQSKNYNTDGGGRDQGECDEVEDEDDLKHQRDDGEDFPKNIVTYIERNVEYEGGHDYPR